MAVLGKGRYTVTVTPEDGRDRLDLHALSIGKKATFAVDGTSGGYQVELANDSTNNGTLRLQGASVILHASFFNNGVIAGRSLSTDDRFFGGTIVNHGLVTNGAGNAFIVQSDILNQADGVIRSTQQFGLALIGSVTNDGLIDVKDSTVSFQLFGTAGTLTNLVNSILTGGACRVAGLSILELVGTPITTLGAGAAMTLDGLDARFGVFNGTEDITLEATLRRIEKTAALHLLGGRDFAGEQPLDVFGILEIRGGTLATQDLETFAGSTLKGFGVVTGEAHLAGGVLAVGGTLRFEGDVTFEGSVSGSRIVTLAGKDNRIESGSSIGANTLVLEDGNTRVDTDSFNPKHLVLDGATLDLRGGSLDLSGSIELHDAQISGSSPLRVSSDQITSSGDARVRLDVVNTGTIAVLDDTLTFERGLSGSGSVMVADQARVVFGAAAVVGGNQLLRLVGAATAEIAAPGQSSGEFGSFGSGDTIQLAGFSATATRLRWQADDDGSGGDLRLVGDANRTVLHFADGEYRVANFSVFEFSPGVLALTYKSTGAAPAEHLSNVFGADTDPIVSAHVSPIDLHALGLVEMV